MPKMAIRSRYNVKWWAVGNEMYGKWQLGHMPLEEYVKKHNRVAEAMWNVDKSIKLIGVGEVGKWSETMLKVCSDYMNLISEHIYCKEKTDVVEHTKQLSATRLYAKPMPTENTAKKSQNWPVKIFELLWMNGISGTATIYTAN